MGSGDIPLHGRLGHTPFQRGAVSVFHVARAQLGPLVKLRLSHDGAFAHSDWHVKCVEVRHLATGECYGFDVDQWIVTTTGSTTASVSLRPTRLWNEDPQGPNAADEFASRAVVVAPAPLFD